MATLKSTTGSPAPAPQAAPRPGPPPGPIPKPMPSAGMAMSPVAILGIVVALLGIAMAMVGMILVIVGISGLDAGETAFFSSKLYIIGQSMMAPATPMALAGGFIWLAERTRKSTAP